jgi:hypothetical protein
VGAALKEAGMNGHRDIANGGDRELPRFAAAAIAAQLQGDTETTLRLIRMLAEGPRPRSVKNLLDDSSED